MSATGQVSPSCTAFICSHSKQRMENPVMHTTCGRLFEAAIAANLPRCPHDQGPLTDLIPFAELKERLKRDSQKAAATNYASKAGSTNGAPVELEPAERRLGQLSISPPSPASQANPTELWKIKNAHKDDIHGIRPFGEGFVSGSKDGCISLWNRKGELSKELYVNDQVDYKQWVTAIGSNTKVLVSGTRDSWLDVWSNDGKPLSRDSFKFSPRIAGGHQSKQRNQSRINCIEVLPVLSNNDSPFFIGGPAHLHLMTVSPKGRFFYKSSIKVHPNDWAYCVQPIKESFGDLLVVVGAQIDLLRRNQRKNPFDSGAWDGSEPIVRENMSERGQRKNYGKQQILRALIPSIERHPMNPNHLAYACFENNRGFGPIRIVDLTARKIIFDGQEHIGRSWDIAFPSSYTLASGGDDHTIKLWDTRMAPKAVKTLPKHSGRVSCLCSPKENLLLAGSCPDNVRSTEEKASLTLWDLRMPKGRQPQKQ